MSSAIRIDPCFAQLFVDDETIETTHRARRVVHQPQKHPTNPVYTVGAPWEGTGVFYLAGVHKNPESGEYMGWYATLNPPGFPRVNYGICLITSEDGIHWRRPALDVNSDLTGGPNNIVLHLDTGWTTAASVIYEEDRAETPWTLIISSCEKGKGGSDYRLYIAHSRDGIHWGLERDLPNGLVHHMHDRLTAFRGPDAQYPYVLLSRWVGNGLEQYCRVRPVHRVAANSDEVDGLPRLVLYPDLEDPTDMQFYHAHAFPYEGMYIGLVQHYRETEDPFGEMELITSRDTVHWQRVRPRQVFLPRSPGGAALGAFDCQITDTALSPPVREGRALRFYYWGGAAMHGNRHLTWGRAVGLAELRADGFASIRAEGFAGELITKPFVWPGGRLQVNLSTLRGAEDGFIKPEFLEEDWGPIAGFTKEEAKPLVGDSLAFEASWNGSPEAAEMLKGRVVRLRFFIENSDLYSFRSSVEA